MAYLKEKGYEARAFYLNILYVILLALGALLTSTLNAELFLDKEIVGAPIYIDSNGTLVQNGSVPNEILAGDGEGTGNPRYRRCYIDGTQAQYDAATPKGCIAIAGVEDTDGNFVAANDAAKDQLATMDALNGIAITVIVFNVIVGIHSVIMHFGKDPSKFGITYHFMFQWVISLVNVGLFAGIVGHLNSVEDIQSEANVANNLYYTDVNLFLVGVAGVVITVLDLVGSNMIVYFFCTAEKGYMCNPK
tara:strand:+ start:2673 stop:3416 length:744 start_codon:yes stop_codon:yes gene_type:complete